MSDIQDRTLWMIEHNLVPTGVHLECARKVFKKARAFEILKILLTTPYNDGFISIWYRNGIGDCILNIKTDDGSCVEIPITEEEFNILKEVLTDNETNL